MKLSQILIVITSIAVGVVYAQSDAALGAASGVNVANVPDCAKVCLSNSTQYATDCAQIDVKCLCNSPSYVSALSCCLATNCDAADQQTAIQFNIQECTAVNSSAPNFVGCSPFSLTTGAGGAKTTSFSSSSSANTDVTTLPGGGFTSVPTAYSNTNLGTATFGGNAILTGSCSMPMFAQITERSGAIIQFPQVGCALNRGDCCPYDPSQYLGLTKCPADYTTTAGACCPSGYSVGYSTIGAETPCVSRLSRAYLPASTVSGASLISEVAFSRRFTLVGTPKDSLSGGAIAGIVIGAVIAAAGTPAFLILIIRNMKKNKRQKAEEKQGDGVTFPPVEPALDQTVNISEVPATTAPMSPHELASPEKRTPVTTKGMPLPATMNRTNTGPPAYEVPATVPLEMPGSTYMHEHHPAYESTDSNPRTPPRSPPQTPSAVSTRSPVLSPSSPFRSDSPSNAGTFTVTPLGSPRFREGTM